ncbi:hypothetical protein [Magnetospirillum molischianum]|nr:hypothetical protein [Magnetospirillum molischianum]
MLSENSPPPSLLAWSALARLVAAVLCLVPLWAAVGWALGWWGTPP